MSLKIVKNFTLDEEAIDYLEKRKSEARNFNASQFISSLLISLANKENKEKVVKAKLITCLKCGTEYSDAIKQCPTCATKEVVERDQAEREADAMLKHNQEAADTAKYLGRMKETERRLKLNEALYAKLFDIFEKTDALEKMSDKTYEQLVDEYHEHGIHVGVKNILVYLEYIDNQKKEVGLDGRKDKLGGV